MWNDIDVKFWKKGLRKEIKKIETGQQEETKGLSPNGKKLETKGKKILRQIMEWWSKKELD